MTTCRWCGREFPTSHSGRFEKLYCGDLCRARFHYALRRWALKAYETGLVPLECFKRFAPEEGHYGGEEV